MIIKLLNVLHKRMEGSISDIYIADKAVKLSEEVINKSLPNSPISASMIQLSYKLNHNGWVFFNIDQDVNFTL